jgi:hypothetical protein
VVGKTCRTPCRLNVAADGPFTVSVALNGYVPQSVPVRVMQPEDPRLGSGDSSNASMHLDPNPIFVELERAPPPVPATKKKSTAHRPVAATRAPTTAAGSGTPPPSAAQQPIQPASSSTAPWPMPR